MCAECVCSELTLLSIDLCARLSVCLSVCLYILTCVVVQAGAEETTAVTRRGTNHDIRFTTALTPRSDILLRRRRHTTLHKATRPTPTL